MTSFGIQLTEANFHRWKLKVFDNCARKCNARYKHGLMDLILTDAQWLVCNGAAAKPQR